MAVKENSTTNHKSLYLGSRGSPFKKRPCGPVLKVRQQNPKTPGALRGWVWGSLVPAAACHFENTRIQGEAVRAFHSAILLAAAYMEGYCL